MSGTTAVAAYLHRDRLYVANVGDSRAVLGRMDTSRKSMQAIDLSDDHKPGRADERERVERAGGVVDQMAFPIFTNGTVRWMRGGPDRVMDRSGMGGLAMSRSLGDLHLRPWISSTPELTERQLDSRDKMVVLGSDGVWDQMSSQEAVEIAGRHGDPSTAAREIAGIARRRWQTETDNTISDDITAVVMRLGGSGGSNPSSLPTSPSSPVRLQRFHGSGGMVSRFGNTEPDSPTTGTPMRRRGQTTGSLDLSATLGSDRKGAQTLPAYQPSVCTPDASRRPGSNVRKRGEGVSGRSGPRSVSTGRHDLAAPGSSRGPERLELLPPAGRRSGGHR
mmetsp:Transcript_46254/g.91676  ORF Transcript_46254/g.91676 Transcript_46254/m.91676 type:complete len:334 (-) Transcript_46254:45-1046(-)